MELSHSLLLVLLMHSVAAFGDDDHFFNPLQGPGWSPVSNPLQGPGRSPVSNPDWPSWPWGSGRNENSRRPLENNVVETKENCCSDVQQSLDGITLFVKQNVTDVLQSIERRLSRMEADTQQLQRRVPKGVSFACPSGYDEVAGKCMFFTDTTSNYVNGEVACSTAGGRLAIIDNCNLLHDIAAHLHNVDSKVTGFWVGATDGKTEGKWVWSDGREVQRGAALWAQNVKSPINEPNGGVAENCLLMRPKYNYRFADWKCDDSTYKSPFCQYNDDKCSSPRVRIVGRCVEFLSNIATDWAGAGAKCVHNGGQLAKVDDCNFLAAIMAYIPTSGLTPTEGYWIGGSDLEEEGTWQWMDGTPVTMGIPYWGQDGKKINTVLEPNNLNAGENCGEIKASVRWMMNDLHCTATANNAACEAPHIIVV